MMTQREFRQNNGANAAPRVWFITVVGASVNVAHGQMGGKLQNSTETCRPVNVGKANAKTAEQVAMEQAERLILKKRREGYREYDQRGVCLEELVENTIDFDTPVRNFRFFKPKKEIPPGLLDKARNGQAWYLRKRDGEMFILSRGMGEPKLFARTMERQHKNEVGTELTWDHRFSHIVDAAKMIMPYKSMLLGELVMDRNGIDDRRHVQSVIKSKTEEALRKQRENGRLSLYLFAVAFWDGQDYLSKLPYKAGIELIHDFDYSQIADHGPPIFMPVEVFDRNVVGSPEEALLKAQEKGWEGWVIIDPMGVLGEKAYNFRGKTDRPGEVISKWKPEIEDDFIVYWDPARGIGEVSTKERFAGGIESVGLYQYNTRGELVPICMCAAGMTEEMRRTLREKDFPQIWTILFDERYYLSRGQQSNALRHPRFVEVVNDKKANECVNERLD